MRGITAGRAHVRRSRMRTACPRGKVSVLHVFSRLQLLSLCQFVKSSDSPTHHSPTKLLLITMHAANTKLNRLHQS